MVSNKRIYNLVQKIPQKCIECAILNQIHNPNANYYLEDEKFIRREDIIDDGEKCAYIKTIVERILIDNKIYKKLEACDLQIESLEETGITKKGISFISHIVDYIDLEFGERPKLKYIVDAIYKTNNMLKVSLNDWDNFRSPTSGTVPQGFAVVQEGEYQNYELLREVCNEYKNTIQNRDV